MDGYRLDAIGLATDAETRAGFRKRGVSQWTRHNLLAWIEYKFGKVTVNRKLDKFILEKQKMFTDCLGQNWQVMCILEHHITGQKTW